MSNKFCHCGNPKSQQAIQCKQCSQAALYPNANTRAEQAYQLHVVQRYTLDEVGKMLGGVTRERARALVNKAKNLRKEEIMPPRKQFNASLPGASCTQEVKAGLEAIAAIERRSIAEIIRMAVTDYVLKHKPEPVATK